MEVHRLAPDLSVAAQLKPSDLKAIAERGFRSIIINRPDGEGDDQASSEAIQREAERHDLTVRYLPVISGQITDEDISAFGAAMHELQAPALAYCRTGTRSASLWALSQAGHLSADASIEAAKKAGYDIEPLSRRIEARSKGASEGIAPQRARDVVIVGGGAAGISVAASLLKRKPDLDIVVIEPKERHDYQPGWTMVGGGVFTLDQTERAEAQVMPKGIEWVHAACQGFAPERDEVILEDGTRIAYKMLVAAPGLKLHWDGVDGLRKALGKNGVTSNYKRDLAPYTWHLASTLHEGRALFTQPPMPIKCAGAPQKAMYLSCDEWRRRGVLSQMDVSFHNAGGVLFGVQEYVPALMEYVERYGIDLAFNETLIAVDGEAQEATFKVQRGDETEEVTRGFDMLHVCPPQTGHDFVAQSPLANDAGWIDVDQETMQHTRFENVFALGDACSTPNAKTAAAVRKQVPVVADNVVSVMEGKAATASYDGYGSCPLTVERGKIVLAEFTYGGVVAPSFPTWINDGTKATKKAWMLKAKMLPGLYFDAMLKGREWLAAPGVAAPRQAEAGGDGAVIRRAA